MRVWRPERILFFNIFLVLMTLVATAAAIWQFTARNRPLFAIFSVEGPATIDKTVYSRMRILLRNWGGVAAENTTVTLDVIATSHTKPRKSLSWATRISGPVYPGQELSLRPDLEFRDLMKNGYRFRLISNVQCMSAVPVAFRHLKIVRMLSHSQKQVWDWDENTWKLVGTDLNNLQVAAE